MKQTTKKAIAVLLSLSMILSLTACLKLKTPDAAKAKKAENAVETPALTEAPTSAPTDKPIPTEAPTPAPTDTPVPTEAPTPVPTDTPAPTEVPFDVAVSEAGKKLEQVQSMHIDLQMNMEMKLVILGESTPLNINMFWHMDATKDPIRARMDVSLSALEEDMSSLIYVAWDGENTILYVSEDNGATWKKQTNPKNASLPQSPDAALELFSRFGDSIQKTGTAQVNGRTATVYTGKVEGKYLLQFLESTGYGEEMGSIMGSEVSEEALANISDIGVTFMIDEESGLPVRYVIDMTEALKSMIEAALAQSMGDAGLGEVGITLEVPSAVLELVLSQFDSVAPIEIPEAALNAPEA